MDDEVGTAEAIDALRAKLDLPAAWRVATAFCPYCAGAGVQVRADGSEAPCLPCEGTGDLLGSMLLDAYRQGRDSVMWQVEQVSELVARVIESSAEVDLGRLRRSQGL